MKSKQLKQAQNAEMAKLSHEKRKVKTGNSYTC